MGAGSNACDDVGGDALPLAMVILAEGADLQGAAGQCVVLAPAGLPYLGQGVGGAGQKEKKNTIQKQVAGQGEAAAGSLSYLHGPGDTAGHQQGIWSLRSWQGSRFPRFREDLAGQRKRHASGRLMLSTHTSGKPHGTHTDTEP